jgi:magnesium-transporting ATPase (P-type)
MSFFSILTLKRCFQMSKDKWPPLDEICSFNKAIVNKEPKNGLRAEFFEEFGGILALEDLLQTSLAEGLPDSEAAEVINGEPAPYHQRREHFGDNNMPERQKRTLISMIWEGCQDEVILILAACAVVSLALGIAFPES